MLTKAEIESAAARLDEAEESGWYRLGVPIETIAIASYRDVTWPDGDAYICDAASR